VRQMVDERKRFEGWVIGVEDEERREGRRRGGSLQGGDGVRDSRRK
jgi:hypothetical protein